MFTSFLFLHKWALGGFSPSLSLDQSEVFPKKKPLTKLFCGLFKQKSTSVAGNEGNRNKNYQNNVRWLNLREYFQFCPSLCMVLAISIPKKPNFCKVADHLNIYCIIKYPSANVHVCWNHAQTCPFKVKIPYCVWARFTVNAMHESHLRAVGASENSEWQVEFQAKSIYRSIILFSEDFFGKE